MSVYVDTSAAMKLVIEEAETAVITEYLQSRADEHALMSSFLLHTELHLAVSRHPAQIDRDKVSDILSTITLVDLERTDLLVAGALGGTLRSFDAIHVATALRVGAEELVAYDHKLTAAAVQAGLTVNSPA